MFVFPFILMNENQIMFSQVIKSNILIYYFVSFYKFTNLCELQHAPLHNQGVRPDNCTVSFQLSLIQPSIDIHNVSLMFHS